MWGQLIFSSLPASPVAALRGALLWKSGTGDVVALCPDCLWVGRAPDPVSQPRPVHPGPPALNPGCNSESQKNSEKYVPLLGPRPGK